jgi:hypothetical protein
MNLIKHCAVTAISALFMLSISAHVFANVDYLNDPYSRGKCEALNGSPNITCTGAYYSVRTQPTNPDNYAFFYITAATHNLPNANPTLGFLAKHNGRNYSCVTNLEGNAKFMMGAINLPYFAVEIGPDGYCKNLFFVTGSPYVPVERRSSSSASSVRRGAPLVPLSQ